MIENKPDTIDRTALPLPNSSVSDTLQLASPAEIAAEEEDQLLSLPDPSTLPVSIDALSEKNSYADSFASLSSNFVDSKTQQTTENPSGAKAEQDQTSDAKTKQDQTSDAKAKQDQTSDAKAKQDQTSGSNAEQVRVVETSASKRKSSDESFAKSSRGTSFSSLSIVPDKLAAGNKVTINAENIAGPIPELPTDEASALDILDEVLSSEIASEGTVNSQLHSEKNDSTVAVQDKPATADAPNSKLSNDDASKPTAIHEDVQANNSSAIVSGPTAANGKVPQLQVNDTQVRLTILVFIYFLT